MPASAQALASFLAFSFVLSSSSSPSVAAATPGIKKLNNGLEFPIVSFGLQVYDDDTAYEYTSKSLPVCRL